MAWDFLKWGIIAIGTIILAMYTVVVFILCNERKKK
jgi:hypothetical protein